MSPLQLPGRRRMARVVVPTVAALSLMIGGTPASAAPNDGAPTEPGWAAATPKQVPDGKISAKVRQKLRQQKTVDIWVTLDARADLSAAYEIDDWTRRGQYVLDALRDTARSSQADLRADLDRSRANYTSYFITNAVRITSASPDLVSELAARSDVRQIADTTVLDLPEETQADEAGVTAGAPEWGVTKIGADKVWEEYHASGEGVVVANLDSGVQFDHPALVSSYRGNVGGGAFDHAYNWFDPSGQCAAAACDTQSHGTHVMGTMVGDDRAGNQIGVAPGATWIAARGCLSTGCPDTMLISGGQWLLAPTDLSGANPRPELRPHVINNSWGADNGTAIDLWYSDVVTAWKAAGIFPVFANGNAGSACGTTGSPADNPGVYSVGNTTSTDTVSPRSSRGTASDAEMTPDIAAPGTGIRSAMPGDGYALKSGTSMAAPHVAGGIALLLSASPSLIGDEQGIIDLLGKSAVDISDLKCGGTADDNHSAGEGRLGIHAAVGASPRQPLSAVTGKVTDAAAGGAVAGAQLVFTGPRHVTTVAGTDGGYTVHLPVGEYTITASAFGFKARTESLAVVADRGLSLDLPLTALAKRGVSGQVRDGDGNPIAGATVVVADTPFTTTTDQRGEYRIPAVPIGSYRVTVTGSPCVIPTTENLKVVGQASRDQAANVSLAVRLPWAKDAYGYQCRLGEARWVEGTNRLTMSANWSGTAKIDLPFPFTLYGDTSKVAYASTSGSLSFGYNDGQTSWNPLPAALLPNLALFPYWAATRFDERSAVYTTTFGEAPHRSMVVEWRDVPISGTDDRIDYEVIFDEQGKITFNYRGLDADQPLTLGERASIGIENNAGDIAFQYAYDTPALADGLSISWLLPEHGWIEGTVTDANDGKPVAGATVDVVDADYTGPARTTDAQGRYRVEVFTGQSTVTATNPYYQATRAKVHVKRNGEVLRQDLVLRTPAIQPDQASLEVTLPSGTTGKQSVRIANPSTEPLSYDTVALGPLLASDAPGGTPGKVVREFRVPRSNIWGALSIGTEWYSQTFMGKLDEFTVDGVRTGRSWQPIPTPGPYATDLAYDNSRGLICSVFAKYDNAIQCMDPKTAKLAPRIMHNPWNLVSNTGLTYRADDDSFFVGGPALGELYHIGGASRGNGRVLSSCMTGKPISGLAWHPTSRLVWMTAFDDAQLIYALNPDTCEVVRTVPFPDQGYRGGGIEVDESGRLMVTSPSTNKVFTIETGDSARMSPTWLSLDGAAGIVSRDQDGALTLDIDTTGLAVGRYTTELVVRNNSGRSPVLRIPVTLTIT
ncbi:S8 family serine peptidase [Micromonospora peucetia]|uniref:S8 family serine peptidase n=1 Tax=Micromonospora peucetia TaxID=47871 RepID=UPI00331D7C6D